MLNSSPMVWVDPNAHQQTTKKTDVHDQLTQRGNVQTWNVGVRTKMAMETRSRDARASSQLYRLGSAVVHNPRVRQFMLEQK